MSATPENGVLWRLMQLETWRRDREQARERERVPERVAVIEREQRNHSEDIKTLASEVAGLRRAIIVSALSITGGLALFSLTVYAIFG